VEGLTRVVPLPVERPDYYPGCSERDLEDRRGDWCRAVPGRRQSRRSGRRDAPRAPAQCRLSDDERRRGKHAVRRAKPSTTPQHSDNRAGVRPHYSSMSDDDDVAPENQRPKDHYAGFETTNGTTFPMSSHRRDH